MYHYTYEITTNAPTDERQRYIGVRSSECPPKDDSYWGSCRSFLEWQKVNGTESLAKNIFAIHQTRALAVEHEIKLHNHFEVSTNKEFFNRAKQTVVGFDTTGVSFEVSDEAREKLRIANTGKPVSEAAREKIRQFNLGKKHSEATKAKMSIFHSTRKRTPRSEETKQKLREANLGKTLGKKYAQVTCPNCSKIGGETGMKSWHFKHCRVGGVTFLDI